MKIKTSYFFFLVTILSLLTVNQIVIQYFLHNKKNDAKIINIAGKQRMLSQKINQLSYRNLNVNNANKKLLLETVSLWKKSHFALIKNDDSLKIKGTSNKKILTKLNEISSNIFTVEKIIKNNTLSNENLNQINRNLDAYLPKMDAIVKDLENETNKKLSLIIMLEFILSVISILVIYIEYKFIINPSYNKIIDKNKILNEIAWKQSHEVRKPVATIIGLKDLIVNDKSLSEKQKKMSYKYLFEAADELDHVIKEITRVIEKNKT